MQLTFTPQFSLPFFFCIAFSISTAAQSDFWLRASESDGFFTSHSFHSVVTKEGSYYLAGEFWKDIIFDEFSASIADENDVQDSFIVQTDEEGNATNFWHISGSAYERITDLEVNDAGELWACGFFGTTLIYDNNIFESPGIYDGFVMQVDANGELLNFFQLSTTGFDSAINNDQMEMDEEGDLWLLAIL